MVVDKLKAQSSKLKKVPSSKLAARCDRLAVEGWILKFFLNFDLGPWSIVKSSILKLRPSIH
jgi:hypothetical protein